MWFQNKCNSINSNEENWYNNIYTVITAIIRSTATTITIKWQQQQNIPQSHTKSKNVRTYRIFFTCNPSTNSIVSTALFLFAFFILLFSLWLFVRGVFLLPFLLLLFSFFIVLEGVFSTFATIFFWAVFYRFCVSLACASAYNTNYAIDLST